MNRLSLAAAFIFMTGCAMSSVGSPRYPSSIPDEDEQIAAASNKADIALCRTNAINLSINDRIGYLTEAINSLERLLRGLSDRNKARVQKQIEELQFFKSKSDTDHYFWDAGSTCPRQLNFPSPKADSISSGRLEAFERGLSYENIALCSHGRGSYSIHDRKEFLDAAIQIFKTLASDSSNEVSAQAAKELYKLTPLSAKAHAKDLSFWDVGSTCPR